jgi:hypothetical protein
MHLRSRLAACLAAACLAVLAIGPTAPASAYTTDLSAPVILVHGYGVGTCPGYDMGAYWGILTNFVRDRGWTGPIVPVTYYTCDVNGTTINSSGSHSTYYGSGHYLGTHTQNTDIRHLAYHLAWFIYNNYSSHGQSVQVVGHSMGGYIMRWMIYREQAGDPNFPPYLYVQDAEDISTPQGGAGSAYLTYFACQGTLQCQQFTNGSSFITELQASGKNPQATNGTDWSAMGSDSCDITTADNATDMGPVHKVKYTNPCYNHVSYLTDTSTANDATADYQNPPNSTFTHSTTMPHSLAQVDQALRSNAW